MPPAQSPNKIRNVSTSTSHQWLHDSGDDSSIVSDAQKLGSSINSCGRDRASTALKATYILLHWCAH
eukprot:10166657-Karenia_brevis.AAC.1